MKKYLDRHKKAHWKFCQRYKIKSDRVLKANKPDSIIKDHTEKKMPVGRYDNSIRKKYIH